MKPAMSLPQLSVPLASLLAGWRGYLPASTDETFESGYVFSGPAMTYTNEPDGVLYYGYTSGGRSLWVDLVTVDPEDVPALWQRQFVRHWQMRDGGERVLQRCQELHIRALREQPGDPYRTLHLDAWLCGALQPSQVPAFVRAMKRDALAKKHSFWRRNEERWRNALAFLAALAVFALLIVGVLWLDGEARREQAQQDKPVAIHRD